jgi:hypothetical protein
VWICPGAGTETGAPAAVLNYSNYEVVLEKDEMTISPSTEFGKIASEMSQEGATVVAVDGVPALEDPSFTDAEGVLHPGVLEFRLSGDRVVIRGDVSTDTLVGIANSLSNAAAS